MTHILFFILLSAGAHPIMEQERRALALEVVEDGSLIEVQLIADSPQTQQVSYTLEVTGRSTSKHRGRTGLVAGKKHVLSTMRAEKDENWCVRAVVEEDGREPYELIEGDCR